LPKSSAVASSEFSSSVSLRFPHEMEVARVSNAEGGGAAAVDVDAVGLSIAGASTGAAFLPFTSSRSTTRCPVYVM